MPLVLAQHTSPSTDQIREFVIAGHGNLEKLKRMLADNPELLNAEYQWGANDRETAIQGAAQLGNAPIAEYLLEKGVPLDICTAAMLGRKDEVGRQLLADSYNIHATGAHSIPLLPHAALSGNLELVQLVFRRGADTGSSLALQNAVMKGNLDIVRWLIEKTSPDINAKNFQGKTPLAVARERNFGDIARFLQDRGATA